MFKPGISGNPDGRPKGTFGGRIQALAELDRILATGANKKFLARALEKDFRKDPVKFFKTVIMPLLPREAKLAVENDGIVLWRNLLGQDVKAEDVGDGEKGPVGSEQ